MKFGFRKKFVAPFYFIYLLFLQVVKESLCKRVGLTLADLSKLATSIGKPLDINVSWKYADESSKEIFFKEISEALAHKSQAVMINFDPTPLIGEDFSGPYEPLAAYHRKSDRC